ncbi:DUF2264 domain-containing protein [Sporolactobacillus shoreicorticis]|uniref:DUF2264 domain-containing protein n=1 Tax=Sporolactobacillus shoreicorticis TaxID=1923877 RepID=A0ABW5S0Z0_9BACL|nr:DUF2264 domain-containing protein [Sporolactobacillus shoreicorticis]MCO7124725.1 DUF2264 domain-containing protein [Sporolactobacillus shoreicorticis]
MTIQLFNAQIKNNSLRTKVDVEAALCNILEPVMDVLRRQNEPGHLRISDSGAVYDQLRTQVEGFLRLTWALGPLFSDSKKVVQYKEYYELISQGILAGTDPESDYYWGDLNDYDQLFVEMGALSAYLTETKKDFWDHLSKASQQKIYDWMDQVNYHKIPKNNWLLFRNLVNNFFKRAGMPYHPDQMKADLDLVNSYYLEHGWYYDGYPNQIDNYIPFALQYFALLYAVLSDEEDEQIKAFRERGTEFVYSYAKWFATDGAALPFGRSLDYRFAQSAFWSVAALSKIPTEPFSLGQIKHLLLNNLRWWFKQNIFTTDGLIPIGYAYPNMVFAEGYNAPASAYWALKTFLLLAIPDDDPFWQVKEEEDLELPSFSKEPETRMLLARSKSGLELQAFTAGQHSHEHAQGQAKYEKYVYSTTFGFSTPKGTVLLKQGAYDNTLAVAESENFYHTVFGYENYEIHDSYVYSEWKPWDNVSIKNFVIPALPWHVRIHQIVTERKLHVAEGSFSAPDGGTEIQTDAENSAFYKSRVGTVGVVSLSEQLQAELTDPEPNTNILFPKTRLPLLTGILDPGTYTLISLYLGDREDEAFRNGKLILPKVNLEGSKLTFKGDGIEKGIELNELK